MFLYLFLTGRDDNITGAKGSENGKESSEDEYEYEDYTSDSEDLVVYVNPEDIPNSTGEARPKVNEAHDGTISIPNEDRISAFDLDINKLKIKNWEMVGDESDYFNYGFTELMWNV